MQKEILLIIALFNGGWMIFDGVHVLLKGKYFGPEKPGPWSLMFVKIGVDPFRLGIPFVILGASWVVSSLMLYSGIGFAWNLALLVAALSLWYLPVGTILSIISIIMLTLFRDQY